MMDLFDDLQWRGFIHQTTHDNLGSQLSVAPLTLYCGFDPTAESLHIGSLLPIVGLMRFQRAGHRPIALVGGATGMIGDPSGKTDERRLQTREEVERNVEGIRSQLTRFLDFSGTQGAMLVNNADWLCTLSLVDFLRDVGKHFSVNVMMARDSVRRRLEDNESGISYTEFSYQILQSYDFLHLFDTYGCRLQVGGSDQWGNIVAGMDLTRRLREGAETFGLTFPLVTKSDGTKFGKSEAGNVWLEASLTSPYRFYQFWVNQTDEDVPRWLRLFTFLEREEIEALDKTVLESPEKREAQRCLAAEITRMVHGDVGLVQAQRATEAMFGGDLVGLDIATLEDVFSEVPSSEAPGAWLGEERHLVDVLVDLSVLKSKGEVRRLIDNGGLYLNNNRVDSADMRLNASLLLGERIAVIRQGKKRYHLLRFVS